jgi:hypothetical protein
MLRSITAAALLGLGALPAAASGNLLCSVEDETFTINLEGIFSHGLGEALTEAKGEIDIKADLGPLNKALAGKPLALADVKQFWMHGQELKVRLYRDAEGEAQGSLEVVIETARDGDDETAFAGTYTATVRRVDARTGAEEESVSGRGPIACSAG